MARIQPEYIFETSWEVCNKVGGIHTVIGTKALSLINEFGNNVICVGPDVWKDTASHPEFIEDSSLYRSWREHALHQGLRVKVGRWKITGKPIAILVDFSSLIVQKDAILSNLWETFKLDSISGEWEYIESVLFGYSVGKVIESFCRYHNLMNKKVIAHFHEWMTGSGVLYLKQYAPQLGTIFTTHATVLGRSIAGNGYPLYGQIQEYNPDETARRFNIVSKCSLESIAANQANCFTTVSDITATECKFFLRRQPDVITTNGFENTFVPSGKDFDTKRSTARARLKSVAQTLLNQEIKDDCIFITTSGRYEYKNKGLDVFIDGLSRLNYSDKLTKQVAAFITVPANHYEVKRRLIEYKDQMDVHQPISRDYLTHELHWAEHDPILQRLAQMGLHNRPEDKVKVIFVPSYLNGNDGLFNMPYYDILIGMDISVFASYYEPWGYTPLESIAFKVPTITTSLSGFGMWINSLYKQNPSVAVIPRDDNNYDDVVNNIFNHLLDFTLKSDREKEGIREKAHDTSKSALWNNMIKNYKDAYSTALENAENVDSYQDNAAYHKPISLAEYKKYDEKPSWKKVLVQSSTPDALKELYEISMNLWWCWNFDAIELFESIDAVLWEKSEQNPILLLDTLSFAQLDKLSKDKAFLAKVKAVYKNFKDYLKQPYVESTPKVAYFSMEFGIHNSLKIYSGGLGILAGDYLKQASDSRYDMFGIGLLYRYGYFTQKISSAGQQESVYEPQKFTSIPTQMVRDDNGESIKISVAMPGRTLYAKIWRVDVGRIPLYLLDTDIEENSQEDRTITYQLYGGDHEHRLKQEILLGVGGIRAISALGLRPNVYHSNEGHAAFLTIERLRNFMTNDKLNFYEASEVVKNSTLYTTHTPVPAGHDAFSEDLIRTYIPHYADKLSISWDEFMNLGRSYPNNHGEKFSMSNLAIRLCSEVNGVSMLHGKVSRDMFENLWPGYLSDELHIGYVTNGVHYPTWISKPWKALIDNHFDGNCVEEQVKESYWKQIYNVSDEKIWDIRNDLRKDLISYVKKRVKEDWSGQQVSPNEIVQFAENMKPNVLTIGFARRFATYKRAHLLFSNLERLAKIVNDPIRPVQFVFAGKAHPHDGMGQDLIKRIVEISKRPEFLGKIVFVENYNMILAKKLVSGVDIWLNTPTRPLEASGTSGQKAIVNGVLNFSVLDGWWVEGYKPEAGWYLKEEATYHDHDMQNRLDAETIYSLLENTITPLFYDERNEKDVPTEWVRYIKNNFATITPHFNTKRMIDDYYRQYYMNLAERNQAYRSNNYELSKRQVIWKKRLINNWENINVLHVTTNSVGDMPIQLGNHFKAEVQLDLRDLPIDDIKVEVLFTNNFPDDNPSMAKILQAEDLKAVDVKGSVVTYTCDIIPSTPGVYKYAFRIYPLNKNMPNRMDFDLVKWM